MALLRPNIFPPLGVIACFALVKSLACRAAHGNIQPAAGLKLVEKLFLHSVEKDYLIVKTLAC